MSDFHISPCTPADVDEMASAYLSTFENFGLAKFWLCSPSVTQGAREEYLRTRFVGLLEKPEYRQYKLTVGGSDGKLAAWTRWTAPFTLPDAEKERRKALELQKKEDEAAGKKSRWPVGANTEACESFFASHDRAAAKYANYSDMYVMEFLCTVPEYQGRGFGRRLMEQCLAEADAAGKATFLTATAAGRPLYLKMGFEILDEFQLEVEKYGVEPDTTSMEWVMLRPPQASTKTT